MEKFEIEEKIVAMLKTVETGNSTAGDRYE